MAAVLAKRLSGRPDKRIGGIVATLTLGRPTVRNPFLGRKILLVAKAARETAAAVFFGSPATACRLAPLQRFARLVVAMPR